MSTTQPKVIIFKDHAHHNSQRVGILLSNGRVAIKSRDFIKYWPEAIPDEDVIKTFDASFDSKEIEQQIEECWRLRDASKNANNKLREEFNDLTANFTMFER